MIFTFVGVVTMGVRKALKKCNSSPHSSLLSVLPANILRPIKSCQTTIQRFTLFINAVAENFASRGVFAGSTLISALFFKVTRYDLIQIKSTDDKKSQDCEGTAKKYDPKALTHGAS